ncbi:TonB-dependent siderophore receptor [Nostoc sp. FACHB-892]|uniref:TonB-dependent siderophore receptor n=1 Tax=Nostoc sp. FACHB-892 TaxID=2692843 RepID=UPI0016881C78|nr:TonB-dependent siderophore receptor [Nostoc sp. FACHB-892]MBD2730531.1 TonB-dependent siderophore receptor [Nostoc sp. FACHB-892]
MNQLYLLRNLGLAIVIVAIFNQQALAESNTKKTSQTAELVTIKDIPQAKNIQHPYTNIKEWLAQQEQSSPIIQVTGVRLNQTQSGLEIILETSVTSDKLQTSFKSEGNTLTALITNAQLKLSSGNFLRSEKPIAGIKLLQVTNQNPGTVQVTLTGEDGLPTAELFDSDEGLVFAVTPAVTSAEKPTPSPSPSMAPLPTDEESLPLPSSETQPAKPSDAGEEPIELVVTGEGEEGYRVQESTTGTKLPVPQRDLPLSVQVVPQAVIRDRGLTRVEEFTENISGVTRFPGFPFAPGYRVRGFGESYQQLRNGFPDSAFINPHGFANVERVEVLKGPASAIYGGNFAFGGVVNTVTKKPLDQPFYQLNFTAGNYNFFRPAFDIGGPLTANGSLTYRLNASYESANSFRDFVFNEDYFIAPAFTWRVSPRTTLTVEYEYFKISNNIFGANFPPEREFLQVPISRYLSEPDLGPTTGTTHWGYYDFEHRFSDNWRFRQGFSVLVADLNIGSERLASTALEPNRQTLNRESVKGPQNNQLYTLQNEVIGKFNTGSVRHNLLFGVELSRFVYPYTRSSAPLASIDIFNPVYGARPGAYTLLDSAEFGNDSLGIYIQDLVELASNLKVLGGIRFDSVYSFNENRLTNELTDRSDTKISPRVGIVYQPTNSTSVYFNYAQAFAPNTGYITRTEELLQPQTGDQFEFGLKQDFFENRVSATLAFYQITRQNVPTADPDPEFRDFFSVATGEQRSRGIELDIAGEILPGWNIIASYAYTDTEVIKDTNPEIVSDRLPGVPYHSASLWTTYELQSGNLQGLGFGLGLTYAEDAEVILPNTFKIPSYLKADAALFYRRDNYRFGLNFKNLFSTRYYDVDNGFALIPGAPLTVLGTVSINF